jgi:hypothetical protein
VSGRSSETYDEKVCRSVCEAITPKTALSWMLATFRERLLLAGAARAR